MSHHVLRKTTRNEGMSLCLCHDLVNEGHLIHDFRKMYYVANQKHIDKYQINYGTSSKTNMECANINILRLANFNQ